jgi:hypothetical protein
MDVLKVYLSVEMTVASKVQMLVELMDALKVYLSVEMTVALKV